MGIHRGGVDKHGEIVDEKTNLFLIARLTFFKK